MRTQTVDPIFEFAKDAIENALHFISKDEVEANDWMWFYISDGDEHIPFTYAWCLNILNLPRSVIDENVSKIKSGKTWKQLKLLNRRTLRTDTGERVCKRCKELKPLTEYYLNSCREKNTAYYETVCKDCKKESEKQKYYQQSN